MKRKVFVDTSEFISNNFDYKNSKFQALSKRVEYGQIIVGLPTITRHEIEANIRKHVSLSIQALNKSKSSTRILRTLSSSKFDSLFETISTNQICTELIDSLNQYLTACGVEFIPLKKVDSEQIFNLYFKCKPPFKDGKKKHEFPDAFSLAALNRWGESDNSEILVASSDSDIELGCLSFPHLVHVGSIGKLLDILANEFNEFLAGKAVQAYQNLREEIKGYLTDEFEESDYYLEEESGEVNSINIGEVVFDFNLIEVLESSEGEAKSIFAIFGSFNFSAEISYYQGSTDYSQEIGRYYTWNQINKKIEQEQHFSAFVYIDFNIKDPNIHDFLDVSTEGSSVIRVFADKSKIR